jgi:hypothetical protein
MIAVRKREEKSKNGLVREANLKVSSALDGGGGLRQWENDDGDGKKIFCCSK